MRIPTIIRIVQLTLPWISILFMPKDSLRKFSPTTLLASLLVAGMCILAVPYKWWVVNGGLKAKIVNDISFILGPFCVGTLWIFHFTFGKFKRYFLVNVIMDSFFSYLLCKFYQRLKLFRLVNFTPKHIFLSFMSYSLIIYGFQLILKRLR